MFYITQKGEYKAEKVIAVVGKESAATMMIQSLTKGDFLNEYTFRARGIHHLNTEKIVVPVELSWIVESDRKHQEREIESRMGNITGENAMSPKPDTV
jgi:hypothetical protein